MNHAPTRPRSSRPAYAVVLAAIAALVLMVFVSAGSASAGPTAPPHAVPPPPTAPTMANQIQNLDQVKTAIKAYYGDTVTTTLDPVTGTVALHVPSPTSAYAGELAGIEARASKYLANQAAHHPSANKAIVLDIDDTTLNTYEYEIYSSFVFNPTTNAAFVNGSVFPAVFGMPALANAAQAEGYTVFFLTGRPLTQLPGTQTNLTTAGYPAVPTSQLYLKDLTAPWLSSCATTVPVCTTTQYKSLTRQHIESLGYDIVANFGDQFSDLNGGFSDATFKMPNPMYFLP
jgi:hypothetical protein